MAKPPKDPSRYANASYEIGKGRPPKDHYFKPGNTSGGRPKGSKNRTDLEKLLDSRVVTGTDARGRPMRKRLGEVLDRKLVQRALEGDLKAIKLIKDSEARTAAVRERNTPDKATLLAQVEEEQRNAAGAEKFRYAVHQTWALLADLKHHGIVDHVDGEWLIRPYALDAINHWRMNQSDTQGPP